MMDTPYEKLLVDLAHAEVRFIIVGGIAVTLNGFARTTIAVDILVENSPDNIARLLGSLARFGEGHARELSAADFTDAEGAVRIIEDFPLDVFTRLQGKRFEDWMNSVKRFRIGDAELAYLSAEALISIKRDSQREIDRIDVSALRAAQQTPE